MKQRKKRALVPDALQARNAMVGSAPKGNREARPSHLLRFLLVCCCCLSQTLLRSRSYHTCTAPVLVILRLGFRGLFWVTDKKPCGSPLNNSSLLAGWLLFLVGRPST